ncbi:MAG: MEMO1 family protein, partial [Bdellovibrionales bacterium]|nr:MEMO1 family protein [Bdellovibrionales bacterium]
PIEGGDVQDFVGALAEVVQALRVAGQRVVFYAGVDMAHVGLHFGDSERVSDRQLPAIEARDKEYLAAAEAGDPSALYSHVESDHDARRICGFPSLYTMFAAMRRAEIRTRGKLIDYRQAVDPISDCIVTFASMHWTA